MRGGDGGTGLRGITASGGVGFVFTWVGNPQNRTLKCTLESFENTVCCSVLQCVAVYCCVLQYVAVCCSVLQCVALCCTVLHCVALCCVTHPCVLIGGLGIL